MHEAGPSTSKTLLGRLRKDPDNPATWAAFVDRYGPRIYSWCRQLRLQDADAQDVTQIVLLKLVSALHNFHNGGTGSFRAWLKTLTHHAWHDFVESQRRPGQGSGDPRAAEALQTLAARDDLVQRLAEEFDRELLEMAMAHVRLRVAPRTWEAFQLTALEGLSGAEVAARLGMKVSHVFVAKSEVSQRLREEVRRLEE